jgi:hypothetical protein
VCTWTSWRWPTGWRKWILQPRYSCLEEKWKRTVPGNGDINPNNRQKLHKAGMLPFPPPPPTHSSPSSSKVAHVMGKWLYLVVLAGKTILDDKKFVWQCTNYHGGAGQGIPSKTNRGHRILIDKEKNNMKERFVLIEKTAATMKVYYLDESSGRIKN